MESKKLILFQSLCEYNQQETKLQQLMHKAASTVFRRCAPKFEWTQNLQVTVGSDGIEVKQALR